MGQQLMACGHPRSAIVSSDEGTNWCSECERISAMEEKDIFVKTTLSEGGNTTALYWPLYEFHNFLYDVEYLAKQGDLDSTWFVELVELTATEAEAMPGFTGY